MATKVDLDALQQENERLKAAQAAQATQNDQLLDILADLQSDIATLKAGQQGAPRALVDDPQAALDREQAALMEEFKDVPNIEVLAHRLQHGVADAPALRLKVSPAGLPEPTIAEDPRGETCYWKLRWFNFGIEGRAERFRAEGYLKVEKSELQDPDSLPSLSTIDQYVRKGERGLEVLGKIPRKVFAFKKKRDALRNGRMLTSEAAMRDHVSNQVASLAGNSGGNADQAGSTVQSQFSMTIKEQPKERVTA
jgi:hypothetical protein